MAKKKSKKSKKYKVSYKGLKVLKRRLEEIEEEVSGRELKKVRKHLQCVRAILASCSPNATPRMSSGTYST